MLRIGLRTFIGRDIKSMWLLATPLYVYHNEKQNNNIMRYNNIINYKQHNRGIVFLLLDGRIKVLTLFNLSRIYTITHEKINVR